MFKNRPLALLCCALSATAVLVLSLSTQQKCLLLITALVLAALAYTLARLRPSVKKLMYYAVFLLVGCSLALLSSLLFFNHHLAQIREGVGQEHAIEGVVLERRSSTSFSSSFRVALLSLDGETSYETVILECDYVSPLQCGNYVSIHATQRDFKEMAGYHEETAVIADGCTRILVSESEDACLILEERCEDLRIRLIQWNHALAARLQQAVGEEEGALASALLLGNRSYLSAETSLQFRRAGISHLLALSGMHVSVIAAFLELLLRKLRVSKMLRAVCVPTVLVGYLLLTGASASTVRAVVMIVFLYLAFLLGSQYDSVTAVSIVPAAFMLLTPYAVYDLSLWMSFLAAFSIVVFYPMLRSLGTKIRGVERPVPLWRRGCAALLEALGTGIAANAALMLLTSAVFGEFSLASIPATILLSIPMSLLLICSIPALLLAAVPAFALPCRLLAGLMLTGARRISEIDNVLVSTGGEAERWLLLLLTAVLILLAVIKIHRPVLFLSVPTVMAAILTVSVLITLAVPYRAIEASEDSGGFTVLCEGGRMVAYDHSDGFGSNVAVLVAIMEEERCTELDDLILTEYDNRRPYLLYELSASVLVRRVRLPVPTTDREAAIARRIEQEAERLGIRVLYHTEGLCVTRQGG